MEKKRNADKNVVLSGLPCCMCCSFPQMCCEMTREFPLIGTKLYHIDHCHRFRLVLQLRGGVFADEFPKNIHYTLSYRAHGKHSCVRTAQPDSS